MHNMENDIDRGWAWVILGATTLGYFLIGFNIYSSGVFTVAILEKFGEELSKASTVGSALVGMQQLTGPIAGIFINQFGCRVTVVLGGIVVLSGMTIAFFATDTNTIIGSVGILTGFGHGLVFTALFVAVGHSFHKFRAFASGVSTAGAGFGMFVGPPINRILLDRFGLSGTLLLLGAIGSHLCVIGLLLRPSSLERKQAKDKSHVSKYSVEEKRNALNCCSNICQRIHSSMKFSLENIVNGAFILYMLSMCAHNTGEAATFVHLPNYAEIKGSSKHEAAILVTVMGVGSIAAKFLTGFAANDERISSRLLFVGQIGITAILTLTFPLYSGSYGGQMVFAAGFGLFLNGAFSLITSITVELLGVENLANGVGFVNFMCGVGYLLGPPIAGLIIDRGGTYTESFIFSGSMLLASSVLVLCSTLFKRPSRTEEKDLNNFEMVIGSDGADKAVAYKENVCAPDDIITETDISDDGIVELRPLQSEEI